MADYWYWPVPGYTEANTYDGHGKARDIPAPKGTPVVAVRSGVVTYAAKNCVHNYGKEVGVDKCGGGYGNYVIIDHQDGFISLYAHLTDIYVEKGVHISHGKTLGTIGSTGNSTGYHLHIEIRLNGVKQEPLNYIDPAGPTVASSKVPIESYTESYDDLPASYYSVVEAGGTTVGQRVAGLTPQPIHPYANIWVDSEKTQLLASITHDSHKPNSLQSFEYHRMDGSGESAIITLFDDNWENIELALHKYWDSIYIEYGYYGTGVKSELVKHMIQNYNISFLSTGTILSIESVTEGVYKNLQQKNITLNTDNPTVAVKKICEELKFKIVDEYFDESTSLTDMPSPFNIVADYPITYIMETIIPQAAEEGGEIFKFYIDSDGYPHFEKIGYTNAATKTDNLRTYIHQKGYDSVVIDFTVDIKGHFGGSGALEINTGYRSSVFDSQTKQPSSYQVDKATVVTGATGDIFHTSSTQSIPQVDSSGYSSTQMKNQLYYYAKSMEYDQYEATLTIVGDPTIKLYDFIRVINVTDDGYLHHTSGVYFIDGIIDNVQGGQMTTTLKLHKNAAAGDIDGIEIINPKVRIR